MERYGTKPEQFAKIGLKNHRHSVNNPYSQFQDEYTLEEILAAPMVHEPLTKLQCCPTSDGSGAVVLASEEFVRRHSLEEKAVEIMGQTMVTDTPETFDQSSSIALIGSEMTRRASQKVYEETGVGPEDVDVIELHDCFSTNELITYEALGLCGEGEGGKLIDEGAVTYGGRVVVNPSGGLISKGHPLGATGLAQCSELSWQLRGEADARQVQGAKVALQHNIGLGGAVVVTMYRKGFTA
jgi:acetyl-CoA acetyltransferase